MRPKFFSHYFTKRGEMAVYIIKTAQNKASIVNSSVGLQIANKYAYKLRCIFPVLCHGKRRGGEGMKRGGKERSRGGEVG